MFQQSYNGLQTLKTINITLEIVIPTDSSN